MFRLVRLKSSPWLGWPLWNICVILSTFMTYHRVCNYINTTGATSGAEIAYHSRAYEFTPVFSGVPVPRSLDLCVCFVDRCLSFRPFCFGHCVVCSSSIYGFWLPLWYLQTLLRHEICFSVCRYILIWQFCNSAIQYYKFWAS